MKYRYLGTRGALNETSGQGPSASPPAPPPMGRVSAGGRAPSEAGSRLVLERAALAGLMPAEVAFELDVVPLEVDGETLVVGALDGDDIAKADKLSFSLARPVTLRQVGWHELRLKREALYGDPRRSRKQAVLASRTMSAPWPDDFFEADAVTASGGGGASTLSYSAGEVLDRPPGHAPVASHEGRSGFLASIDTTKPLGGPAGMFLYTIEEGQRVLMRRPDGTMDVVVGPRRVWRGRNVFKAMTHHVAHPGDYLIIRYRDGRQEHLAGPSEVWFDPRVHQAIERQEALQLAAKEAVVVYSQKEGTGVVQRRVEYGPALFIPRPGEWLHTFSWHASKGGSKGVVKVPNGLVFQKLWLMPDQMYHDVTDVRTADDAVLTIRLMIFFELVDIDRMLDATHDPIGDFVNAASSDVVDFTGRHDFESFKRNTERLNELEAYRQLSGRAGQCGYRINKVVYRGYGAADRLQQMHDQAIEARTRLQLDRATEQQAQDLENFRLDSQLARAGKRRGEQSSEVAHDLEIAAQKHEAHLRRSEAVAEAARERRRLDAEQRRSLRALEDARRREHLASLRDLGVDLTAYLTQGRADRVIEVRGRGGNGATHVHLEPGPGPIAPGRREGPEAG